MAQVPATQGPQGGRMARREQPLERMRRDFASLIDRLWGGWPTPYDQEFGAMRQWDFDVTENDKEIVVRAEMPGFEENEVDVQLDNEVLTIKAQKEQKGNGHEEYCSFYRSIVLPRIDAEKAQASYRNGVLELHIPRAEGAQPKHIKLQGQQASTQAQATASKKAKK